MVSSSASSGIRSDVPLPEDTRMRITVRRGAAAALVALTLNSVANFLTGPVVVVLGVDDASEVYRLLSLSLVFITAPLTVLSGIWLRAYPRNRGSIALVTLPGLGVMLGMFARATTLEPFAMNLFGLVWVAATIALLLAADTVLKDGAGDPTAQRSLIARVAIAFVVARYIYFVVPFLIMFGFVPLGLLNIVVVVLIILTFTRVRRLLL